MLIPIKNKYHSGVYINPAHVTHVEATLIEHYDPDNNHRKSCVYDCQINFVGGQHVMCVEQDKEVAQRISDALTDQYHPVNII